MSPLCVVLLSTFTLSSCSMRILQARSCISALCLRYLCICIANTLLATGWLLLSVLSVLGSLIPLLETPPTLPKLPSKPIITNDRRMTTVRPAEGLRVGKQRVPSDKLVLERPVMEGIKLDRAVSLERYVHAQHVKFATQRSVKRSSSSSSSPSTTQSSFTPPEVTVPPESTTASPDAVSSTQSFLGSSDSHRLSPRGRKLKLFRKSSERSQSRGDTTSPERFAPHGTNACLLRACSINMIFDREATRSQSGFNLSPLSLQTTNTQSGTTKDGSVSSTLLLPYSSLT
ncbi:hypothetical protein BDW22DRAFT_7149 [Trametopsis cervina]|nr:hypothetical protein BDW22DRAFT_7149 [Trametopsis cervina]